MTKLRTHHCDELRRTHIDQSVKLAGWIHRKRDHGQVLFIDLRDHYGITQVVLHNPELIEQASKIPLESVITVDGTVVERAHDSVNQSIPTGDIEVIAQRVELESIADALPIQVNSDRDAGDELRLKYRYLDLRRTHMHDRMKFRCEVIKAIREEMHELGFNEFTTPILTSSSPEGARDFLVPSRLHPGKFYALPQAPQIFKQLIMIAGFDRYFQIAPCFRDEDSRADRAPGEFYQLDIEMSFVTQEEIFDAIEPLMKRIFGRFGCGKTVDPHQFPRISHDEAMLKYGSDKPDLRNPIEIVDVTDLFKSSKFQAFSKAVSGGAVVRAIPLPPSVQQPPRSFFDKLTDTAIAAGSKGLGYITFDEDSSAKGPIAKFLEADELRSIRSACAGSHVIFFICDQKEAASKLSGFVRSELGRELHLLDESAFKFCWVVDFPFFELDDHGAIAFCHNPFSMPQGGLEALNNAGTKDELLAIKAYQYDLVCNGVELSSGAIRNHKLDVLFKAFDLAGYKREEVESKFSALVNAFKYGAPPHGGIAPGIDRILMLLADVHNIREVILFPMNQRAEDLMMGAPSAVKAEQLRELRIAATKKPILDSADCASL